MFDSTLLSTHPRHLVKQHVQKSFFGCFVLIRLVVPVNNVFVNHQSVLVHHRFKSINDAVFFAYVSSDFFDIYCLFGLLKVFFKQLSYDTITKVSLNNQFGYVVLLTVSQNVQKRCV